MVSALAFYRPGCRRYTGEVVSSHQTTAPKSHNVVRQASLTIPSRRRSIIPDQTGTCRFSAQPPSTARSYKV